MRKCIRFLCFFIFIGCGDRLPVGYAPFVCSSTTTAHLCRGESGRDGRDGINGQNGANGTNAQDGRDGINGRDGVPGEQGQAGQSGPQGPQGPEGPAGRDGRDGRDGTDGRDGQPGPQGQQGPQGPAGQNGRDGQDGRDGRDGADGHNVAFRLRVATSTMCPPNGGVLIEVGLNDNGQPGLQSDEVDSSVCVPRGRDGQTGPMGPAGANGLSAVFRLTRVQNIPSCNPGSGVVVEVGLDSDRDGTLDDLEVDRQESSWVCDGRTGSQGSAGPQGPQGQQGPAGQNGMNGTNGTNGTSCTMVQTGTCGGVVVCTDGRAVPITCGRDGNPGPQGPAGQNGFNAAFRTSIALPSACPFGGTRMESGLDLNRNDRLDTFEVNPLLTFNVCNGAPGTSFPPTPPAGTCFQRCGMASLTGACYCDPVCHSIGDCCADKLNYCPAPPSPPDAGVPPDSGSMAPDGGFQTIDGGLMSIDGGVQPIDGGVQSIDGGIMSIDGGVVTIDGGVQSIDGGVSGQPDAMTMDSGIMPDARMMDSGVHPDASVPPPPPTLACNALTGTMMLYIGTTAVNVRLGFTTLTSTVGARNESNRLFSNTSSIASNPQWTGVYAWQRSFLGFTTQERSIWCSQNIRCFNRCGFNVSQRFNDLACICRQDESMQPAMPLPQRMIPHPSRLPPEVP